MTDIRAVEGVMLSVRDAKDLADAISHLGALAAERGSRLTARMVDLRTQLLTAISDGGTDDDARTSVPQGDWMPLSAHDLLDTATAARLLGCTTGNVRDLARRGTLPAHRTGGRWLLEADAVHRHVQHLRH